MDETLTLTFSPPIEHEGGKVEKLTLREPRVANVIGAAKEVTGTTPDAQRRRNIALLGYVADVAPEVVRKMPVSQFERAMAFLNGFLEAPAMDAWVGERPDMLTIPLDPPITIGPTTWDELVLKEPTTGDVEMAEKELRAGMTDAAIRGYQVALVSKSSGIPAGPLHSLPIRKLDEASRYVARFLDAGRATGASSSPS